MSVKLLESVQQSLGYAELKKVDSVTGQAADAGSASARDKFSQAAIPAVLIALSKLSASDKGAGIILQTDMTADWVSRLFGSRSKEAIWRITAYAGLTEGEVLQRMNEIAVAAVKITKQYLPSTADIKTVKLFFEAQQSHILLFLLPVLKIGDLLYEDTLDDNTNKMQGPVSSLIAGVGSTFSNPVTESETNKPK